MFDWLKRTFGDSESNDRQRPEAEPEFRPAKLPPRRSEFTQTATSSSSLCDGPGATARPTARAATTIESFSANFDRELFTKLMERVSTQWPQVLTPTRVKELTEFCVSLRHNEEKPMSFTVQHAGVTTSFGIRAFMDDVEFPDVEFFSFPEIIKTISHDYDQVCEELGY